MVLSPALEKPDMRESLGLHFRDDVKFVLLIFFAHDNTPMNRTVRWNSNLIRTKLSIAFTVQSKFLHGDPNNCFRYEQKMCADRLYIIFILINTLIKLLHEAKLGVLN